MCAADAKRSAARLDEGDRRTPDVSAPRSDADWRVATLGRMRALIGEADPDVVEERKWIKPTNPAGVPVWSHAGIVCTGETYKAVVKLTFAKGAALDDPAGLFNASLDGNVRRAIDIREGEEVDTEAFRALIREAVAHNTSAAAASDRSFDPLRRRPMAAAKKGLYANIQAKRERIAHGSGERMRKPGSDGAPSSDSFEKSEKTSQAAKAKKRSAAAKKGAAKKGVAKKTATSKTASRTPAKKAASRKTTARKTITKKTAVRKTAARKTTARKTTAKRATAKKTTAKKATARKATARKATARKTTARKAITKKAAIRKTASRKTASRKTTASKSRAKTTASKKAT